MKILVTGGAGFIGSHVVRRFVDKYPEYLIYNLDALTYAGNLENLKTIESKPNYTFIKGDITDENFINELFKTHNFDGVIHLAAESHVDRSIKDPFSFAQTNVMGTLSLLQAAKLYWNKKFKDKLLFDNFTLAPIEKDLVNYKLLNKSEKDYLFRYHLKIYSEYSSSLNKNERRWLASLI